MEAKRIQADLLATHHLQGRDTAHGALSGGTLGKNCLARAHFSLFEAFWGTRSNAVALIAITSQAQSQGSLQADEIWLFLLLVLELFFQRGYLCLLPHAHY